MTSLSLKRFLPGATGTAIACAVVAGTFAAPATAASRDCEVRGSRTEEASRYARVYSVRRVRDEDVAVRRFYGCRLATGRRTWLGDVGLGGVHLDRISPVRLAGRYVATANEYTAATGDAIGALIQVRDLRTGGFVHRFDSPSEPNTYDVTDLELHANGSVAWIARIVAGTPATVTYEVRHLAAGSAQATVLDSGAAVGRRSLAASGSTLYWTAGGEPRAARFG